MANIKKIQKTFLLSIDGWGISNKEKGNAVYHARTPFMDSLAANKDKYCDLGASGLDVGLPEGVMGNSEVGHLTMGSGRQLFTDFVKINQAIKSGKIAKNPQLLKAFQLTKNRGTKLHLLGLLSDGGVHSHIDHFLAFIRLAKENSVPHCFIHAFMDGRDTKPNSGAKYIKQLIDFTESIQYGKLSTLVGRFYAMDRDKRWERIEKAYDLLVEGKGESAGSTPEEIKTYLEKNYSNKIFDEQIPAAYVLPPEEGKVSNGDVLLFMDFRSDRMREIVETFGIQPPFKAQKRLSDLSVFQMTEYNKAFGLPVLFEPDYAKNVLAEWISAKGLKQFHVAETEKYAHVTFFFNGRQEAEFEGETRKLVPSPNVHTYNLKPEMSMGEVKDEVIAAMERNEDFIMCNFAPPDMVGHTGDYEATITAVEATDRCIAQCAEAAKRSGYAMVVTSDHGNAEEMLDAEGKPKTSHNCNRVPFALILPPGAKESEIRGTPASSLRDVAPTICEIMGISPPSEMEGTSLLK